MRWLSATTPVTVSAVVHDPLDVHAGAHVDPDTRPASRSSAARSASSPPSGYQQPKRASMCGMQASVAGARYGEDPE